MHGRPFRFPSQDNRLTVITEKIGSDHQHQHNCPFLMVVRRDHHCHHHCLKTASTCWQCMHNTHTLATEGHVAVPLLKHCSPPQPRTATMLLPWLQTWRLNAQHSNSQPTCQTTEQGWFLWGSTRENRCLLQET